MTFRTLKFLCFFLISGDNRIISDFLGEWTPPLVSCLVEITRRCVRPVCLVTLYGFEVVEGCQDDLVSSSDQAHGRQQLQNQRFGPGQNTTVRHAVSLLCGGHFVLVFTTWGSCCSDSERSR